MKKERRNEYDLIRTVSTLAIVLFHYSFAFIQYGVGGKYICFRQYANGAWGALFVAVFFMLSGSSLYYNWCDRLTSVKGKGGILDFYKKRWLAIFPMFYIAWFIFYMINAIDFGRLWNWGGSKANLLLTLLGMDGYFMYRGLNYYTVGEWFLGAIIMLYIMYPLLQLCMKKLPVTGTVLVILLFGLNTARRMIPAFAAYNERVVISDNINIITCLMSFWTGMLLARLGRSIIKRRTVIPAVIIAVIVITVPLPVSMLILNQLLAVCIYIILSFISICIDGHRESRHFKVYDSLVMFFSRYSYAIFLLHHQIIQRGMSLFTGSEFTYTLSILYFLLNLAGISCAAVILTKVTDAITSAFQGLLSSHKE